MSSVAGTVNADSTDLITNKRSVNTTVLADNGEIIVLGGLIQQDDEESVSGVPGLSRVPGVGRLFRSEGAQTRRTNLMIFIRPTIIRSEADMRAVTANRYDYIRNQQIETSDSGSSSLEALVEMMMSETPRTGRNDGE